MTKYFDWEEVSDTRYPYPTHFQEVLEGQAYWYTRPIEEIFPRTSKYFDICTYQYIDPQHPRCYGCGKFIKKGDWWKYEGLTGPCRNCYESTMFL